MRKIVSIILMIIIILAMVVISFMLTIEVMNAIDGDNVTGVAASGNYAYLSDRNKGLVIIDLSDLDNPVRISRLESNYASGVLIRGNYVYVAQSNGLLIVNVTDPANPVKIGEYVNPGYNYDFTISGNFAYLVGSAGFRIIDISEPTNPVTVGDWILEYGSVTEVAVEGSYAYLKGNSGLRIIDISDPSNPFQVGQYGLDYYIYDLATRGNYTYLATYDRGLVIIDISNSTNPMEIGYFEGRFNSVSVIGSYAYLTGFSEFTIMDISNSTNPVEFGRYHCGSANGFTISKNYAYISGGASGLKILDISDLRNPVSIGVYDDTDIRDYPFETFVVIFILLGGILWLLWRRKYKHKGKSKITENGGILDYVQNLWRKYKHKDESKITGDDDIIGSREVELSVRILKTLQQVKPNIPLQLTRLSQLVDLPITSTENLLLEILSLNPDIGEYSPLEQVFIKHTEIAESTISKMYSPIAMLQTCPHCDNKQSVLIKHCTECKKELSICQICKRGFTDNEVSIKCPHCLNHFHRNHLLEYVKIKGDCPVCKERLQADQLE
jgi:hypothetical protein